MKSLFFIALAPILAESVTPLEDSAGEWKTISYEVNKEGQIDLKYRTVLENFDGYSLWAPYLEG
jgi:hypothetical protein